MFLISLIAVAGGFLFSYDTSVINGANQYLKVHFGLTAFQEGVAGAGAILGCIPGAMFAGFLSNRFGRRCVLFLCAILFPVLNDNPVIGPAKIFLGYAACSLAGLIFVFARLPETKRRTLEEIEALWHPHTSASGVPSQNFPR